MNFPLINVYYVAYVELCFRYWEASKLRYRWLFIFLGQGSIPLVLYCTTDVAKDRIIFIEPEHKSNTIPKMSVNIYTSRSCVSSQMTWFFSNTALSKSPTFSFTFQTERLLRHFHKTCLIWATICIAMAARVTHTGSSWKYLCQICYRIWYSVRTRRVG
jgi:hypothetical protein